MASRLRELVLTTAFVCLVACGSSSDDGLLSGSGGKKDASTGGASGASTTGGSAGVVAGSAGAAAGADAGVDAAAGAAGASVTDAGGDTSDGAGGTTQKGVGPCGEKLCAFLADDYCCKTSSAPPYCANDSVGNGCECSGPLCQTVDIHCDGPEDCPSGEICCADTGFLGGGYDVVECRQNCQQPPITGGPQWEVCHPGGQPCANGNACKADPGILDGYFSCKP
jgi:hypothetical protein